MFQKHQKKFGTPRCGGTTGSGSLSFDPFRLLKTAKMAMFEVIPRASWRSNSGSEPLFTSELTQILKIWSQKFFFPLGSLEDGHVPERRILPQFQNKAFLSNVLKTKVAPNDKKTCWEPSWRSLTSFPILHNSRKSIRTPMFLTKITTKYSKVLKTKVAPNDQRTC